jgi:hypothetical protein
MKTPHRPFFQIACLFLYFFNIQSYASSPAHESNPARQGEATKQTKPATPAKIQSDFFPGNPDLYSPHTRYSIAMHQKSLGEKHGKTEKTNNRNSAAALSRGIYEKLFIKERRSKWENATVPLIKQTGEIGWLRINYAKYSMTDNKGSDSIKSHINIFLIQNYKKDKRLAWIGSAGDEINKLFFIENKGNIYVCSIFFAGMFIIGEGSEVDLEDSESPTSQNFDEMVENIRTHEGLANRATFLLDLGMYFTSSFFSANHWSPHFGEMIISNVTAKDGVFCFEIENITAGDKGKIWVDLDKKKIVDVEETTNPGRDEQPIWKRSFGDGQTEPASIPRIRNRFFLGNPDLHAPWLCRTIDAKRKMLGEEYEKAEKVREKDAAAFLERMIDEEDSFLVKKRTSGWKKTTMPLVKQTGEVVPIQIDYARHAVTGTKNSKSVTEEMDLVLIRDYFGEKNLIWIGSLKRNVCRKFFHKKTGVFFIENDGDIYVCGSYGSFFRITGGAVVSMEDALTSSSKNFDRMVEAACTREYLSKRTTFCLFLKYYFTTHLFASDPTKNTLRNVTAKDGVFCFEIENTQGGDKGKFWVNLAEKKLVNVEEITNPERDETRPPPEKIKAKNPAFHPRK